MPLLTAAVLLNISTVPDAVMLQVSREIVSQMEQGKYSIRISVLLAMKELYKVSSMDDFFNGLL